MQSFIAVNIILRVYGSNFVQKIKNVISEPSLYTVAAEFEIPPVNGDNA